MVDGVPDDVLLRLKAHAHWWLIFAFLVAENACFLGLVVPGLTILVGTGVLIYTGDLSPTAAISAAVLGTWVGDQINYMLGRWGLRRLPVIRRILDRSDRVYGFIQRSPVWIYTFFHFPVYLRTVFPLALGSIRFPFGTWLWIDTCAGLLFVGAYVGLGYGLAHTSTQLVDIARIGSYIGLGFSLLFVVWAVRLIKILIQAMRAPKQDGASPSRPS